MQVGRRFDVMRWLENLDSRLEGAAVVGARERLSPIEDWHTVGELDEPYFFHLPTRSSLVKDNPNYKGIRYMQAENNLGAAPLGFFRDTAGIVRMRGAIESKFKKTEGNGSTSTNFPSSLAPDSTETASVGLDGNGLWYSGSDTDGAAFQMPPGYRPQRQVWGIAPILTWVEDVRAEGENQGQTPKPLRNFEYERWTVLPNGVFAVDTRAAMEYFTTYDPLIYYQTGTMWLDGVNWWAAPVDVEVYHPDAGRPPFGY